MHHKLQLSLLCIFLTTSCAPIKGYDGPELPDTDVALVKTSYYSGLIVLERASIDGVEFSSAGIKVLPGQKSLDLTLAVLDTPRSCRTEVDFDDQSFRSCIETSVVRRQQGQRADPCNRDDFFIYTEWCLQDHHDGNCSVEFSAQAGKVYVVSIVAKGLQATVEVRDEALSLGRAECSRFRTRPVEIQTDQRRGRRGWFF